MEAWVAALRFHVILFIAAKVICAAASSDNSSFVLQPEGGGCEPHTRNLTVYPTACHYVMGSNVTLLEEAAWSAAPDCEAGTFVEYIKLHYCHLASSESPASSATSGLAMLALTIVYFLALGKVADRFFCPALNQLAKLLNMPEDIAGMTLLSFGNGAPDVFAQVAAVARSGGSPPDWGLAVGGFFGAGVFVTHVVLAAVLWSVHTPDVCLDRVPYTRDVSVYLAVVALVMAVFSRGYVMMPEALAFTASYVVYVGVAVFQTRTARARELADSLSLQSRLNASEHRCTPADSQPLDSGQHLEMIDLTSETDVADADFRYLESDSETRPVPKRQASTFSVLCRAPQAILSWADKAVQLALSVVIPQLPDEDDGEEGAESAGEPSWELDVPPLAAPVLAAGLLGIVPPSVELLLVAAGCAALAVTFRVLWPSLMPRLRRVGGCAMVPVIFCLSILWMNTIAGELVALLEAMGIVGKVPSTVLGVTVLAWGNSVGDMVSNCAVAKSGKPRMAMAAIYAGPVFNALVGMALSMLIETMRVDSTPVIWHGHGNEIILLSIFLVLGQLRALLVPATSGWSLSRSHAKWLLLHYLLFTACMILVATGAIPRDCWLESFCT